MKKWVIARPINGISINGDEYAVDDNGKLVCFDSEEQAKDAMFSDYSAIFIVSRGMYVKEIELIEDGDMDIKPAAKRGDTPAEQLGLAPAT